MTKSNDEINIEEISSPSQYNLKEDLKFKLVLLGDSGVGKTNLISRYINNSFQQDSKATIGVEFFSKTYKVNKKKVIKVEIWDTAGQERYKSITSVYYKGAKGAFIVYDITSRKSFNNIDKWIEEIKEKTSKDIKLLVIGNKIDLNEQREISTKEALFKFKDMDISLMEASALDDTNVNESFIEMIKIIYQDYIRRGENENDFSNEKRHGKGIDLKNIGNKVKNENKNVYMCCYW